MIEKLAYPSTALKGQKHRAGKPAHLGPGKPSVTGSAPTAQTPKSRGTYLALSRHTDGCAILVTGGTIDDLLSLPYVEAVAACLAVQLTLAIAFYYQKIIKNKDEV